MPRIRQKAEEYAAADLKAELNAQRARFGLHTFALFGGAIGVSAKGFIRTVPLMMYDKHKVEDLDTKLEDHICDEWRYFCMSRPIKPIMPVEQRTILSDPLNQFTEKG